MKLRRLGLAVAVAIGVQAAPALAAEKTLDYDVYKTRVEPIFLKKRPDHVRCVVCHAHATNAFKLEDLSKGSKSWSDEQSRRNFEVVSRLVIPSDPDASPLLNHPLDVKAGGHAYHSGGRQFANKNDPDWKILAQWAGANMKTTGK